MSETYAPRPQAGHRDGIAESPSLSRPIIVFLLAVPLAWAVLLLFHPSGDGTRIYLDLQDNVTAMLVVHVGMMLFIPLMAAAVYLLVRGVEGMAAQISRLALVPFVIFYGVWEALQGIATGILASEVNGLSGTERTTGAELIQDFAENPLVRDAGVLSSLGSIAFITAAIAAGIALRRNAGAPIAVTVLLGLSGFLITAHPPPFGPTGLALFIAAVLLFVRSGSSARAPTPIGPPVPPGSAA